MGRDASARRAIGIDMSQVQARKDKIVTGLTKGVEFLFKKNKIDWIKGTARLTGKGKVEVSDGQTADARRDAKRSSSPPARRRAACRASTIDRKRIITSDEAIHLREVPKSIAIMGSGAVGVEFASIFRRFGSEVTIIELLPRLVPVEDEAVSAELEKSFRKQGITVHHRHEGDAAKAGARRRRHRGAGWPTARRSRLTADYLLVATGRGPVTDGPRRRGVGPHAREAATSRSTQLFAPACRASRRSATSSRFGQPGHPQLAHVSSAEGHRRSPSGSPDRTSGRSTTTTCPAAPTAIPRSAASA